MEIGTSFGVTTRCGRTRFLRAIFIVPMRNIDIEYLWEGFLMNRQNAERTCGAPVSHPCRTEESGMSVTVWNRVVMCCDVLQHGIVARWAGDLTQVFDLSW